MRVSTLGSFVAGLKAQPGVNASAVNALLAHYGVGAITTQWGDGDSGLSGMYVRPSAFPYNGSLSLSGGYPSNSWQQNQYYVFTGNGAGVTVTATANWSPSPSSARDRATLLSTESGTHMNRIAFVLLSSCLVLGACAPAAKSTASAEPARSKVAAPKTVQGKMAAPVEVQAQVGDRSARVTLDFQAPASNVQVNVHGVDGLVVTSQPTLLEDASFNRGDATSFDIAFTPGAGRSHLVVAVTGSFKGSSLSRVASFAVGSPTVEQQKASDSATTDSNGQRIKMMPGSGQ